MKWIVIVVAVLLGVPALVAVVAFLFVYTRVTPHDELQLIRDNVPSAAIALGLSLLGFVLPVVSAIAHSANVVDCLIWSAIALIVQIAVYFVVKIPVPNLSAKIAAGELAPAIWLGLASLAAGALKVQLQYLDVLDPKDIEIAFREARKKRADAILLLNSPALNTH